MNYAKRAMLGLENRNVDVEIPVSNGKARWEAREKRKEEERASRKVSLQSDKLSRECFELIARRKRQQAKK